ncbi:UNVERIFIED_CONTAM: putative xyloglucan endotransglucosylase/hydrolase protein 30 [Sesamum radiatum]|uniref:Xyloglucan endotransglucosylase/hydrolase n=1 Tax=Sesamum radiatum TaxID=300843 RepID=A0AAW2JP99_SESRA
MQTSNVDTFEKNHDELDIEFLGNVPGKAWRFQTNMYGNGSVSRGREERYRMWFDPSKDSHRYSILWTPTNIIFYVDEIPIREVVRNAAMRGDYPSKPMSVYATIWDASSWATSGGKRKVNYRYQPFVAEFKDLVLEGCIVDPVDQILSSNCTDTAAALMAKDYSTVTPESRKSMRWFRQRHMYYSYCYDTRRYPVPPPECVISPSEREMLTSSGRPKSKTRSGGSQRRRSGGRSTKRRSKAAVDASRHQAAM